MLHKFLLSLLFILVSGFSNPASSFSAEVDSNFFHELQEMKRSLEKKHGLANLECFPFIEKIGFNRDQKGLIRQCLKGLKALAQALPEVRSSNYRSIGIGTDFLRTGGFQTALIPWNASTKELAEFLNDRPSEEKQTEFIDGILSLKKNIISRLGVANLYCNQQISNLNCLHGYERLAEALRIKRVNLKKWRSIVLTHESKRLKDAYALSIGYQENPAAMRKRLESDLHEIWNIRRKMFEKMEERFGKTIRSRLGVVKIFCNLDLTNEECMKGAENISQASSDPVLQSQHWGEVEIDRFNSIAYGDFDLKIGFELSPEEIIKTFANRPSRKNISRDQSLANKLEGYTKNNNAKLRIVCDLEGLHAGQCVKGLQHFINFLKKHRDFRADPTWTDLMLIDGGNLKRVNFALNSSSRESYIYVDANSSYEKFENYLMSFGGRQAR